MHLAHIAFHGGKKKKKKHLFQFQCCNGLPSLVLSAVSYCVEIQALQLETSARANGAEILRWFNVCRNHPPLLLSVAAKERRIHIGTVHSPWNPAPKKKSRLKRCYDSLYQVHCVANFTSKTHMTSCQDLSLRGELAQEEKNTPTHTAT